MRHAIGTLSRQSRSRIVTGAMLCLLCAQPKPEVARGNVCAAAPERGKGLMPSLGARLIGAVLLALLASHPLYAQQPQRVLMLHSFGPQFGDLYARDIRAQLDRQLPGNLELYEQWLVSARFSGSEDDAAFAGYLEALFRDHPIDLVITLGAPAANFVQRHREPLFHAVPALFADVEERRAKAESLGPNEAAVPISVSFPRLVTNILRVLPHTGTVAVLIGNSAIEKYWADEIRDSLAPFRSHVKLTFLNNLSFKEVLKRVANLPANSAILYILLSPAIEGIPQDEDSALAAVHAAANAPLFSYTDAYLGKGIVGGPLISGEQQGRETVAAAVRLLGGQPAAEVGVSPIALSGLRFDGRELRRWKISEADLPSGSTVLYREPTAWERYWWQILVIAAVIVLQTALIVLLLHERRRRLMAEMEAHTRIDEIARMNRRSTAGELSASIAHEVAQPLGAMLRNIEAAEMMLEGDKGVDLNELREIMFDVKRDQYRASEVIRRLRNLLVRVPAETKEIDLNELVREVFEILRAQAAAHRITLTTSLTARPLRVSGDGIQLQQVVLNLVMNSIEAIKLADSSERIITARTKLIDVNTAAVIIEDSGPGIPVEKVTQIFDPFFTTKETGMGMGLSIAQTIIKSHGGQIAVEERARGAAVRFTVPLVTGADQANAHTVTTEAPGVL